jgi:hypothetical protein
MLFADNSVEDLTASYFKFVCESRTAHALINAHIKFLLQMPLLFWKYTYLYFSGAYLLREYNLSMSQVLKGPITYNLIEMWTTRTLPHLSSVIWFPS